MNETDIKTQIGPLLAPIPGDHPGGEYLRYEGTYDRIQEARREDDPNLPQGEWKTALKRANWPEVQRVCRDALQNRSKDLQLAAWLTEAWTVLKGLQGAILGVHLVTALCHEHWEHLFPELDGDDASFRLSPVDWLEQRLPLRLKSVPITKPGDGYAYSFADLELATHREKESRRDPDNDSSSEPAEEDPRVDRAACRLLMDLRDRLNGLRIKTHLTGAQDKQILREYVLSRIQEDGWRQLCLHATQDDALEVCENEILRQQGCLGSGVERIPLVDQELCRGLSPEEIRALSERVTTLSLPAGAEVMKVGSPADAVFFLVQGEVGVFLRTSDGKEQLVRRLGPGASFGEVALVDREPRSATVRTLHPTEVLRLGFDAFDRLDAEGNSTLRTKLYANLASVLAARLRSANLEIGSLK